MKNPQILVEELVNQIITLSNAGDKAQASKLLQSVYVIVQEYPQILWNSNQVWKLAKALLIMYHYDVFDNEDDNIKLAEYAFVYAQRSVELYENTLIEVSEDDYFSSLHTQVVLLATCEDCYLLTIEKLYLKSEDCSEEELRIARALARDTFPFITYSVISKIEEAFDGLRNDSFLDEVCNQIELDNPEISLDKLEYAQKIMKLMLLNW